MNCTGPPLPTFSHTDASNGRCQRGSAFDQFGIDKACDHKNIDNCDTSHNMCQWSTNAEMFAQGNARCIGSVAECPSCSTSGRQTICIEGGDSYTSCTPTGTCYNKPNLKIPLNSPTRAPLIRADDLHQESEQACTGVPDEDLNIWIPGPAQSDVQSRVIDRPDTLTYNELFETKSKYVYYDLPMEVSCRTIATHMNYGDMNQISGNPWCLGHNDPYRAQTCKTNHNAADLKSVQCRPNCDERKTASLCTDGCSQYPTDTCNDHSECQSGPDGCQASPLESMCNWNPTTNTCNNNFYDKATTCFDKLTETNCKSNSACKWHGPTDNLDESQDNTELYTCGDRSVCAKQFVSDSSDYNVSYYSYAEGWKQGRDGLPIACVDEYTQLSESSDSRRFNRSYFRITKSPSQHIDSVEGLQTQAPYLIGPYSMMGRIVPTGDPPGPAAPAVPSCDRCDNGYYFSYLSHVSDDSDISCYLTDKSPLVTSSDSCDYSKPCCGHGACSNAQCTSCSGDSNIQYSGAYCQSRKSSNGYVSTAHTTAENIAINCDNPYGVYSLKGNDCNNYNALRTAYDPSLPKCHRCSTEINCSEAYNLAVQDSIEHNAYCNPGATNEVVNYESPSSDMTKPPHYYDGCHTGMCYMDELMYIENCTLPPSTKECRFWGVGGGGLPNKNPGWDSQRWVGGERNGIYQWCGKHSDGVTCDAFADWTRDVNKPQTVPQTVHPTAYKHGGVYMSNFFKDGQSPQSNYSGRFADLHHTPATYKPWYYIGPSATCKAGETQIDPTSGSKNPEAWPIFSADESQGPIVTYWTGNVPPV